MHKIGLISTLVRRHLDEPDHLFTEKCANIDAAIEESSGVAARLFKSHTIMRKLLALAHRGFVVYSADALDQLFTVRDLTHHHTTFSSLACTVAGIRPNLVVPPVL